jgi:hypothetical protein
MAGFGFNPLDDNDNEVVLFVFASALLEKARVIF